MSKVTVLLIFIFAVLLLGVLAYEDYQDQQTIRECFRSGGTWNTKPFIAVDHYCERPQTPIK